MDGFVKPLAVYFIQAMSASESVSRTTGDIATASYNNTTVCTHRPDCQV